MDKQTASLINAASPAVANLPAGRVLQRKCDCGQHTLGGSECSACSDYGLRRSALSGNSTRGHQSAVPPIVNDVLNSSGQPLENDTRTFMESRFGHDFSRVRVHTDARAAESAKAVNAFAYTVGRDVVFDTNQYVPSTMAGKRLLAHELTHVVQQRETIVDLGRMARFDEGTENLLEREADAQADRVEHGDRSQVQSQNSVGVSRLQRQSKPKAAAPTAGTALVGSCDAVVHGVTHLTGTNLFFGREVSTLSSAQRREVADFVRSWRAAGANQDIIVEGFASVDGPDDFNLTLSCARANTIKRELMSAPNSVPQNRITTEAHGETDQFGSLSQNRRVIIVTLPAVTPPSPTAPSTPPAPSPATPGTKQVPATTASCTPGAGLPNTACGAYAANSWWLPEAYVNNATCACTRTPNSPEYTCIRKVLQDRLAATPASLKTLAASMKPLESSFNPLNIARYKLFVLDHLTHVIYIDHVTAYGSCCCVSGPAPYSAWELVTTVPIPSCAAVGASIAVAGSCHGTPGRF